MIASVELIPLKNFFESLLNLISLDRMTIDFKGINWFYVVNNIEISIIVLKMQWKKHKENS